MKKIKVIKKKDVESLSKDSPKDVAKSPETAKTIVSNVSTWVNEFQKRKREETKTAIETFIAKRPQNASS
ncbi:MAG: hypothetical protein OEQ28_09450 [Acidobacteriota bacterium]|nr:hypothetical protein [Acidobacteriota bacterium]